MPKQHLVNKAEQPKRDWKSGSKVPTQFQAKHYKIDHKQSKKLAPPKANQTWIKVNGDYVLMDSKNHKVIKFIR
ncbi:RcnB family protein [uncultured Acinetobacter sp.]|uniref:RcnB family protein n=1 Tax=uncultured Acinetobacter sp. TaxID=165433 RepID=UPI00262CAE09|nr:RcnB family protein [uncultured Acinetobacter sp.]